MIKLPLRSFGFRSTAGLGLLLTAACGNGAATPGGSGGGGAVGGATTGGSAGKAMSGGGSGGSSTSGGGNKTGAGGTTGSGATGGGASGGATGTGATGGTSRGGSTGTGATGGSGAIGGSASGSAGSGSGGAQGGNGATSTGGSAGAGMAGAAGGLGGSSGSAGNGGTVTLPPLVTSTSGAYWKTDGALTDSTATANVTVNDTMVGQKWDGFGGAFNELGWSFLTSSDMQTKALTLLFSATDGAAFAWGRIPIGASDYAVSRYTEDDTGTDVAAMNPDSNRPQPDDDSLSHFALDRDAQKLIPYVKAAQLINPKLRFWASPWTPPVWMKTGYKTDNGDPNKKGQPAAKPSYFDGGNMSSKFLAQYATYYTKFVQGYQAQGINIEIVSPQNEPGYDQNYPSCLWDKATYTTWIGQYLGPAMQALNVKVMLGTLSNDQTDIDTANGPLMDATAKTFLSVVGVQWNVLDKVNSGTTFGTLPIWATEHKCGNYPWNPMNYPAYNNMQAPNDQAYGVESWGYIRDAITKGKVTAYNAWNMVLDKIGLGIDTSRDWRQDALLVADSGTVTPTPAYYVFRHFSQYVVPGATVVGTSGGDAVAFKNPDGSLIAVMFNSGAANANYVVALGGKKYQFAMPANGWATIKSGP